MHIPIIHWLHWKKGKNIGTLKLCSIKLIVCDELRNVLIALQYLVNSTTWLSFIKRVKMPVHSMSTFKIYYNYCKSVLAFLYFSKYQNLKNWKPPKALSEMFWCKYTEVKPHSVTNSSLNVMLFLSLLCILHTVPWAGSTGFSYSPHLHLQQYFWGPHLSSGFSLGITSS